MTHYSDDDLILRYYGDLPHAADADRVDRHLRDCERCRAAYDEIAGTLKLIEVREAPGRGDQYGLEVWQRIRHRLPEREAGWRDVWFRPDRLAFAGAAAVLLVAAFQAGRLWPAADGPMPSPVPAASAGRTDVRSRLEDEAARQRILLMSVADHLDRSERVLTDIMNVPEGGDISSERWRGFALSLAGQTITHSVQPVQSSGAIWIVYFIPLYSPPRKSDDL